jgi:3-hydroxy-9,10-secoandrosta-1,3,5(10)-triene-9,17-dione monooxygenase
MSEVLVETGAGKSEAPLMDELAARAEAFVPVFRARMEKAEAMRRCPDETVDELTESGLLRLCQPARWGGYELPWDALCHVSRILARGCGSQAWIANIYNDHCQLVGMFPLEAQADVWAKDPKVRISASVEPAGRARRVPGGVRFSGRHRYSSGVDHAHWVVCGGMIMDEGKPPLRAFFLVPRSDISIIDDWEVIGLAGTGSKSFEVKDVFVPEHRMLDGEAHDEGMGPGSAANPAPLYRMPRHDIAGTGFAAVGLGVAEAFLEEYVAYTRGRVSRGQAMAELTGTQIGIGATAAELLAAEQLVLGLPREAMAVLERGERISTEQRKRTRLGAGFAAQLMLGATQRLFNAAGGRALFSDGPMQRLMRDLYGVCAHRGLAWDSCASNYGALMLGK